MPQSVPQNQDRTTSRALGGQSTGSAAPRAQGEGTTNLPIRPLVRSIRTTLSQVPPSQDRSKLSGLSKGTTLIFRPWYSGNVAASSFLTVGLARERAVILLTSVRR